MLIKKTKMRTGGNKMTKKIISITIVILMLLLSACTIQPENTNITNASSASSEVTQTGTTTEPVTGNGYTSAKGVSYPLKDAKGITLSYWYPMNPNAVAYVTNYADTEIWHEVMARTGVTIEFIHPASREEQEQFNVMLSSGDLPDLVFMANTYYKGGAIQGVYDGAFIGAEELASKYAPDFHYQITLNDERVREAYTNGILPSFFKIQETELPQIARPVIRSDWLEEFGMDIPVTLAEFEEYFKNVLNKGVTPFVYDLSSAEYYTCWFGAYDLLPDWFVVDGTVKYGYYEQALKNVLTTLNDWYEKGYILKDFASMKTNQVESMFSTGTLGMIIESVDTARTVAERAGLKVTSTRLPKSYKDQQIHTGLKSWPIAGQDTAITTACKHPEIAAQFLNYAYTVEGAMLYNYGIEGLSYNLVDGVPKYTDHMLRNDKYPTEAANYILRIHFGSKLQTDTPMQFNPSIAISEDAVNFRLKWSDDKTVDNSYYIPPISLTEEESNKRATIMTNVKTYSSEMVLQFITGAKSFDKFDEYMSQLKAYGIEEAIQITQAAYDRYIK